MSEVYLNGKFIGAVENPAEFTENVKTERRKGGISDNLNIYYDKAIDNVQINDGKGRLRRPLIVIKNELKIVFINIKIYNSFMT